MLTKNERMAKLNGAGVDTGKYFTVNLPDGLAKNSTITLTINENGDYTVVNTQTTENDAILNQIIEDGYVRNTKLHRRFVMAQMFQMLNYVSYGGDASGYNDCLRYCYGYGYTFKMMLEEVRVLSKLEVKDAETFQERSHFFTRDVVVDVMKDYIDKLKKYVDELPDKNCKGVPYKRIKGINIFNADLDKKLYAPLRADIYKMQAAGNYTLMYKVLFNFMKNMIKLPYDTPKSKAWIDAYKGSGAFYTLKNLVMFHDCGIITEPYNVVVRGTDAVAYISAKLDEYQGEYYRMFALMKKVIADNNFDFQDRMEEIYG